MGNLLVQAMTMGAASNLAELRRIVAKSVDLVTYEPTNAGAWDVVRSI